MSCGCIFPLLLPAIFISPVSRIEKIQSTILFIYKLNFQPRRVYLYASGVVSAGCPRASDVKQAAPIVNAVDDQGKFLVRQYRLEKLNGSGLLQTAFAAPDSFNQIFYRFKLTYAGKDRVAGKMSVKYPAAGREIEGRDNPPLFILRTGLDAFTD